MSTKHWNATHGDSLSPEYKAWVKMLMRCYNPNTVRFERWGGRGIVVCESWRVSYLAFLADMGRRPTAGHQLDRIDNDANYEPGNCRWATAAEQARNTKRTVLLTLNGKTQCVKDWAKEFQMCAGTIGWRVRQGWSAERALQIVQS